MVKVKKGYAAAILLAGILGFGGWSVFSTQSTYGGDGTDHDKYVLTTSLYQKIPHYTGTSIVARDGKLQGNVSLCYHCIAKPITFDKPHSHGFEETLCFLGGNPLDITDFDAVVEVTIDGKKHVLTQPGCVSFPPDMPHCPISVKNVSPEKPIVFLEVSLSSSYGVPKEAGK